MGVTIHLLGVALALSVVLFLFRNRRGLQYLSLFGFAIGALFLQLFIISDLSPEDNVSLGGQLLSVVGPFLLMIPILHLRLVGRKPWMFFFLIPVVYLAASILLVVLAVNLGLLPL